MYVFHFQTIEVMCSVGGEGGKGFVNEHQQLQHIGLEDRIFKYSQSAMSAADADQASASASATSGARAVQSGRYHGAGAILQSRLVHTGWKFPHSVVTEQDERWLFDVEVTTLHDNDDLDSFSFLHFV